MCTTNTGRAEQVNVPDNMYDVIVVGSGITGGWAAKELTEKGLRTLVLEAGRPISPDDDYVDHVPVWEMPFRGLRDRKKQLEDQPIQSTCYACDEWSAKFFVSDKEHPYSTDPNKPFRWIRGRQVGGRSIVWGRQSYRWSDLDFEANARDGIAVDWPIRYKDIAPWYDHVEEFAGISGSIEGLPQLPDGKFQPPMDLNCVEKDVAARIKEHYDDKRRLIIGRCANLTKPKPEWDRQCNFRDMCSTGSTYGGLFSSQHDTLPAAH